MKYQAGFQDTTVEQQKYMAMSEKVTILTFSNVALANKSGRNIEFSKLNLNWCKSD